MKEKLKSILIIAGISIIVIFGLVFGACGKDNLVSQEKSVVVESVMYDDAVLEESFSLRTTNSTIKNTSAISYSTENGISDSMITLEEELEESSQERKIIKTGSLSFEVKSLSEAEEKIFSWIEGFEGYIADSWTNRTNLNITIKVPSVHFEEAMSSTGDLGTLLSRSISTEDVTENYYDLETRLETRRTLQEKLSSYLENAKNISDLLEIERQLNDVTGEIESIEKQFRRLTNQIDFSTISISCRLPANTTDSGFETPDFIQKLKDFGYNALQFICNFGIGILYIILVGVPTILLIALIYWLCFGKVGLVKKLFNKLK